MLTPDKRIKTAAPYGEGISLSTHDGGTFTVHCGDQDYPFTSKDELLQWEGYLPFHADLIKLNPESEEEHWS